MVGMKVCNRCKQEKDIQSFTKDTGKKDGLRTICRYCNADSRRNSYIKNKETIAKRSREYYERNKELIAEANRKRYQDNIDERKRYAREYRLNNAESIRKRNHDWYHSNKEKVNEYRTKNKEVIAQWHKEYKIKNEKYFKKYGREYRLSNKNSIAEKKRKYYEENKEAISAQKSEYNKNNRHIIAEYERNKSQVDATYRLARNLRGRVRGSLKGVLKCDSTINLVGCTIDELWLHLESQFIEGMTRENHGANGWHIDHIVPCASFDLTDEEQQKICFHYTNLQPLWAEDNFRKGDRLPHKWEGK